MPAGLVAGLPQASSLDAAPRERLTETHASRPSRSGSLPEGLLRVPPARARLPEAHVRSVSATKWPPEAPRAFAVTVTPLRRAVDRRVRLHNAFEGRLPGVAPHRSTSSTTLHGRCSSPKSAAGNDRTSSPTARTQPSTETPFLPAVRLQLAALERDFGSHEGRRLLVRA
jgi:hypothetical protein